MALTPLGSGKGLHRRFLLRLGAYWQPFLFASMPRRGRLSHIWCLFANTDALDEECQGLSRRTLRRLFAADTKRIDRRDGRSEHRASECCCELHRRREASGIRQQRNPESLL